MGGLFPYRMLAPSAAARMPLFAEPRALPASLLELPDCSFCSQPRGDGGGGRATGEEATGKGRDLAMGKAWGGRPLGCTAAGARPTAQAPSTTSTSASSGRPQK